MIRRLQIEDFNPENEHIGAAFHAEGFLPGTWEAAQFIETWHRWIDAGNGAAWGLFATDRLVGFLGALIYPDPHSNQLAAQVTAWFVLPTFRGWKSLELFREFETWAERRGAARMDATYLIGSMPSNATNFFESKGYAAVETVFRKEVKQNRRAVS